MAVQIHQDSYRTEAEASNQRPAPTPECLELIAGLNHDLAGELKSIMMYTYYSAMLTGPYRRELRSLFLSEIADEQGHAQFLADKIAALGGEPTTDARPVAHADKPRDMLEHVLKAEQQAITGYTTRLRESDAFGDFGLKVVLENMIADETRHKEEVERILAGWQVVNVEQSHNNGGPAQE